MKRIALPPWLFFALAALAGLLQAAALALTQIGRASCRERV
mgnify:CR=1 FL=1